jgi:hypothetical protein
MRGLSWRPARLSRPAGRVVVHIGRNKAGSTTIQQYCLARRERLLTEGVRYVLFGHMAGSVPGVDGFPYVPQLADHARRHAAETILVSNEFMFGWPFEYTEAMARDLAGLDVRILGYIRPYAPWVRPCYADEVWGGRLKQNFDAYLESLWPRISAWPFLRGFGECFGSRNVRVRGLDDALIRGPGLIGDFRLALGLGPDTEAVAPANVAAHWAVLEALRALVPEESELGWPQPMEAAIEALKPKLEACAVAHAAALAEPEFFTEDQATRLGKLYEEDVTRIATAFGMPVSVVTQPPIRRSTCPSWALLPAAFLWDAARSASADPLTAPLGGTLADMATALRRVT